MEDDIFKDFPEIENEEWLPNFNLPFEEFLTAEAQQNVTDEDGAKETARTNATSTETVTLNDEEIGDFIEQNKNKNTAKKTSTDLNVWKRWCSSVGESRPMKDIPPDELNNLLCHFFIKVRKLDNSEFEPGTLTSFQRSYDRYLRQLGKPYSILSDKQFERSRETLESKRKQLQLAGKGRRPNKALALSDDEMEKLWSEGQLGDHSPDALIHTVWLNNTMHFGWRARDEHRKVLLGDLELRQEEGEEGRQYVIWHTERGSKTRSGGKEFGPERYFDPRMYATGTDRCLVKIFKTYLKRRPQEMMNADSPFYLAVVKNPSSGIWYKKQPLGVHSLGNFMKVMASSADLRGKHTNHSARRTMITGLRHENVNPLDISQLSGHKNLKSIDSYSTVSEAQQREMSLLISNRSSGREVLTPRSTIAGSSTRTASPSNNPVPTSFSGAVFNQCTIILGSAKAPPPPKRRRRVIDSDDSD